MHSSFSELFSWLSYRFRGRFELELERESHSTRRRALDLTWNGGGREAGPLRFVKWKKTAIASTFHFLQKRTNEQAIRRTMTL
jgi:hypothetical protein